MLIVIIPLLAVHARVYHLDDISTSGQPSPSLNGTLTLHLRHTSPIQYPPAGR
jgi:hypothetical protein